MNGKCQITNLKSQHRAVSSPKSQVSSQAPDLRPFDSLRSLRACLRLETCDLRLGLTCDLRLGTGPRLGPPCDWFDVKSQELTPNAPMKSQQPNPNGARAGSTALQRRSGPFRAGPRAHPSSLATGCWLLVVSAKQAFLGYWLLAIGCFLRSRPAAVDGTQFAAVQACAVAGERDQVRQRALTFGHSETAAVRRLV